MINIKAQQTLVKFSKAYDSYPHLHLTPLRVGCGLLYNDIVLRAAKACPVLIDVGANHRHLVGVVLPFVFIVEQRAVGVNHILQSPVKLMITQLHRVILHLVDGHIYRFALLLIGNGGALIKESLSEQDNCVNIIAASNSAEKNNFVSYLSYLVCIHIASLIIINRHTPAHISRATVAGSHPSSSAGWFGSPSATNPPAPAASARQSPHA